ncbi:Uncharacterised protein [Mycobacteroides abscessus]|nr:Uncharacterised protein [Mycobacteroides abscessus]
MCPGSTSWIRSHPLASLNASAPTSCWPSSSHCGAAHVGACTPLVIEPMGTSAASKDGQRPLNIDRLTWPCSSDTPLARWASRSPMWAMLKVEGSSSAPSAMMRSTGTPGSKVESPDSPKYRRTRSTGNRSMPAGTGVCVVNTVLDRTTVKAVSTSSPCCPMYSRMRSSPRNPACPSLV